METVFIVFKQLILELLLGFFLYPNFICYFFILTVTCWIPITLSGITGPFRCENMWLEHPSNKSLEVVPDFHP